MIGVTETGTRGTNQYARRPGTPGPVPPVGLLRQAGTQVLAEQVRCGDVWGERCSTPVGPPEWSHPGHPTAGMRWWAAHSERTPPELLVRLAGAHQDQLVKQVGWPARRVRLRPEVVTGIQRGVAGNPAAPPAALRTLMNHPAVQIRQAVAVHPNSPPEVLKHLSWDRDSRVRQLVAGRADTPMDILIYLADDGAIPVRRQVAANPATPPEALQELQADPSREVAAAAKDNLALPAGTQVARQPAR